MCVCMCMCVCLTETEGEGCVRGELGASSANGVCVSVCVCM